MKSFITNKICYPVALFVSNILNKVVKSKRDFSMNVNGRLMYANSFDRLITLLLWKNSWKESFEINTLKNIIKPGMCVVDIGANIGFHTLHMAELVGNDGKVVAFEPDPENFRLLKKAISANNISNVSLIQKAVCNQSGTSHLYLSGGNKGDHRIFDSKDNRNNIPIEALKLDDIAADLPKIDVIKIDIQGSEILALRGMKNIIDSNNQLIVLCEYAPSLLKLAGHTDEEFSELIRHLNLNISLIDEKNKSLVPIKHGDLSGICDQNSYINLYLSK